MYTKAQWCTWRKRKKVTDRLISTLGILSHLDDHWGPTFSIVIHLIPMNSLKWGNLINVENVKIFPYSYLHDFIIYICTIKGLK